MADLPPHTGCSLIRLAPLTAPASRGSVRDPLTILERTLLYIGSRSFLSYVSSSCFVLVVFALHTRPSPFTSPHHSSPPPSSHLTLCTSDSFSKFSPFLDLCLFLLHRHAACRWQP